MTETTNANPQQPESKNFWDGNIWAIVVSTIGGIIALYFEYHYFQNSNFKNNDMNVNFTALDIFLGYLFSGIFLFLAFFLILSTITLFTKMEDKVETFGICLVLSIIMGVFISLSAQLGLNSAKKSTLIIENVFNQVKKTKAGQIITKKIGQLEGNRDIDKIEIYFARNLNNYISSIDSTPNLSKFVSFYFFNISEVKTYMHNNSFEINYDKGSNKNDNSRILSFFCKNNSVECNFYYNDTYGKDTLKKIEIICKNLDFYKKLRNSILKDTCYKTEYSYNDFQDKFMYGRVIKIDEEYGDWTIFAAIDFNERNTIEVKKVKEYLIKIDDYYPNGVYESIREEFIIEGRKRFLEQTE